MPKRIACKTLVVVFALAILTTGVSLSSGGPTKARAEAAKSASCHSTWATADTAEVTVADLHRALDCLAEDVQGKIDEDIDTTANAFWHVHDVERARWAADFFGSVLTAINLGISTIGQIANVKSIGEQLPQVAASGKWLSLTAYLAGLGTVEEAGDNLDWALNGPAYIDGIKQMYERAGKTRSEAEFKDSVKASLQGLVWVRAPATEREKGIPLLTYGSRVLLARVVNHVAQLKAEFPSEQSANPSALRTALATAKNVHTTLLEARAGNVRAALRGTDGREGDDLAMGSIAELRKVQGQLLGQYDSTLKQKQITVGVDSAKSMGRAGLLHLTYGSDRSLGNVQTSILAVDSLSWTAAKYAFTSDIRSLVAQIPQQMVNSLSSELSNTWYLANVALSEVERNLASPPDATPVASNSAASTNRPDNPACWPLYKKQDEYPQASHEYKVAKFFEHVMRSEQLSDDDKLSCLAPILEDILDRRFQVSKHDPSPLEVVIGHSSPLLFRRLVERGMRVTSAIEDCSIHYYLKNEVLSKRVQGIIEVLLDYGLTEGCMKNAPDKGLICGLTFGVKTAHYDVKQGVEAVRFLASKSLNVHALCSYGQTIDYILQLTAEEKRRLEPIAAELAKATQAHGGVLPDAYPRLHFQVASCNWGGYPIFFPEEESEKKLNASPKYYVIAWVLDPIIVTDRNKIFGIFSRAFHAAQEKCKDRQTIAEVHLIHWREEYRNWASSNLLVRNVQETHFAWGYATDSGKVLFYNNPQAATAERQSSVLAFLKRANVDARVDMRDLGANPFVYEGKVVLVEPRFERMLAKSEALFISAWGDGIVFIVSNVPTGGFTQQTKVLLAARVLGNRETKTPAGGEALLPHLKYIDAFSGKYTENDLKWAMNQLKLE